MATTEHTTSHIILDYLNGCNGSDNLYFDRLFGRNIKYTTGVKVCRDNGCNWLIVAIMSHLPELAGEEFIVAELIKNEDNSAVLVFSDGDNHVLAKQTFEYADAPCNLTFYFENEVLMLDRER